MDYSLEPIIDEMKQEIDKWIAYINDKDADKIVKRTTLQAGIHGYALLKYDGSRADLTDNLLDLSVPGKSRLSTSGGLTEEQVREQIVPELARYMQHRLKALPPAVLDYRFKFEGNFQVSGGFVKVPILEYVDEAKKKLLLDRISLYISSKLEAGKYPTKPLETFFLARHLLDEELFPVLDSGRIIGVYERIQELNKGSKHLPEHRNTLTVALRNWVEEQWLPRYFENTGSGWQKEYTKKSGAVLAQSGSGQEAVELVIYSAVSILRYEPSYSRSTGLTFLNCVTALGSTRADRLIREGSGALAKDVTRLKAELVECIANDVFAEVSIHMKQESGESYGQALRFLITLLERGFPKSYQIKLKSAVKSWLPIKGLAKSGTHRFFANALEYPEVHPLLVEYARAAMETFEWYTDTEGEKCCMPGSYAVFGLGLTDREYFPLVGEYMEKVDVEHQSVQNGFTAALYGHFGINTETLSILVTCLLYSTDSLKLKMMKEIEDEQLLRLLLNQVRGLQYYQVEHLVYLIWGGKDKLKKLADKAEGEKKQNLEELMQACRRG
ncbi:MULTISPECIES: DUF6138 family protein [unclassified Paenibacillus]|uniref:DUF6138 family protein n=1 Tax=unclassified Paenibacillus TaxID=185978 RepID=UPI0024056309|nr:MULTISPECIES: DUF6138 family protein [unclassified Paenibacillus]MDF9839250.1 hypothetical protein [Paenibacillus sp. PastF-2]MDF9845831.1 hypothetical protein [Paenibacillus sp. PastM-2]MDF9852404.1 hypothetical protein [Paenibacillus sp. PastF-1]MDH6477866.1 hypothetical protein [Paenibacillus sp. PastH-2]MDH6505605.1 hypothetical protein [Paenibacillus sp. PastM-3]